MQSLSSNLPPLNSKTRRQFQLKRRFFAFVRRLRVLRLPQLYARISQPSFRHTRNAPSNATCCVSRIFTFILQNKLAKNSPSIDVDRHVRNARVGARVLEQRFARAVADARVDCARAKLSGSASAQKAAANCERSNIKCRRRPLTNCSSFDFAPE